MKTSSQIPKEKNLVLPKSKYTAAYFQIPPIKDISFKQNIAPYFQIPIKFKETNI
jgi:hypothetical protein